MELIDKYVINSKLTDAARRMKLVKDEAQAQRKRREGATVDNISSNPVTVEQPSLTVSNNKG